MADRTPRDVQTRETETRKKSWTVPSLLPQPAPKEGWEYRYIRTAILGTLDNVNVSAKFREGWEPVPASEVPELQVINDHDGRFPDNIEIGGLLLCRIPTEVIEQRRAYYDGMARHQIEAVDRDYLRESDPRMPLLKPERATRVSRFGTD